MKIELEIRGMHCGSCAANIQEELETVNGVKSVEVLFAGGSAIVEFDAGTVQLESLLSRIRALGYDASAATAPAEA